MKEGGAEIPLNSGNTLLKQTVAYILWSTNAEDVKLVTNRRQAETSEEVCRLVSEQILLQDRG